MTAKPPLQKILQRILHTEDESKQNHRTGSIKPQEKKDKESETSIDSAAHNQILNNRNN
jgi:hypothetical protein